MSLHSEITEKLKFVLSNGFSVSDCDDFGMAKRCKLISQKFKIIIWNDRGDYNAIIESGSFTFNLISLTNFISTNTSKTEYSKCTTLEEIDNLFELNHKQINSFVEKLSETDYEKYQIYHEREIWNMK